MAVLKIIEVMSSSEKSWEEATRNAVVRASASVKHIKSAWVKDQSVSIKDGKVSEFRVTLKLSFELE